MDMSMNKDFIEKLSNSSKEDLTNMLNSYFGIIVDILNSPSEDVSDGECIDMLCSFLESENIVSFDWR